MDQHGKYTRKEVLSEIQNLLFGEISITSDETKNKLISLGEKADLINDYNSDLLDRVYVVMDLEEKLGIVLEDGDKYTTIKDVLDAVCKQLKKSGRLL